MTIGAKYRAFVQAARSISEHPASPELYAFADAAYQYHVNCFGLLADAHWRYEILTAYKACAVRDPLRRVYILSVRECDQQPQDQLASVAHEMYHRVTSRRKGLGGLHKHLWVDEMLAFLATHHVMCEQGLSDYATAELRLCFAQNERLGIDTLKGLRRKPDLGNLLSSQYPPGFRASIAVLGISIQSVVGWEAMCRLVHCRKWSDWLDGLPETQRKHVQVIIKP